MKRYLWTLLMIVGIAAIAAAGLRIGRSPDPTYTAREWMNGSRYWQYDRVIEQVASKNKVDPLLVKSMVWRESGFHPEKVGTSGERGLLQVTEIAAQEWAKAQRIETFVPTDLFDPKTNLDAGVWYLRRALERWRAKDNPVPFALAEYNAGKSRVDRWVAATGKGDQATASELLEVMDIASTKRYIEDISARTKFYKVRGY